MTLDPSRCLAFLTIGDRDPDIFSILPADGKFAVKIVDYGEKDRGIGAYRWHGSTKYPRISALFKTGALSLGEADYFWFPDDDLAGLGNADVAKLFRVAHENKFRLCQPSLSPASQNIGWPVTKHVPGSVCRWTNFVEPMAALFSAEALSICLPTFEENLSSYGLDFVWARLLGYDGLGVIDAVQVRHMISSPATAPLSNGKTAIQEMHEVLQKHGIDYNTARNSVGSF